MSSILATAWISEGSENEGGDEYWLDGDPVHVEVERTEDGSIRIGATRSIGMSEDAGLYFTPSEAKDLMVEIGAAIAEAKKWISIRPS